MRMILIMLLLVSSLPGNAQDVYSFSPTGYETLQGPLPLQFDVTFTFEEDADGEFTLVVNMDGENFVEEIAYQKVSEVKEVEVKFSNNFWSEGKTYNNTFVLKYRKGEPYLLEQTTDYQNYSLKYIIFEQWQE